MTAGSGEALRQQLEAAIKDAFIDVTLQTRGYGHGVTPWVHIAAAVEPFLAAARVATATEIAEALEARQDAAYPDAPTLISVRDAAALTREIGGAADA